MYCSVALRAGGRRPSVFNIVHFDCASRHKEATACPSSTSQLPKVARTWCAFHSLISTCALRHSAKSFCNISTSKSAPRMVCFSMLFTFWLRNVLRASHHNGVQFLISHLPRWLRTRRFFWLFLFFSSDSFSYLIALSSSCPSVNIVGSWTSKLLSTS